MSHDRAAGAIIVGATAIFIGIVPKAHAQLEEITVTAPKA